MYSLIPGCHLLLLPTHIAPARGEGEFIASIEDIEDIEEQYHAQSS
jgi:hypothetical protein